jgi:hypothetical protein
MRLSCLSIETPLLRRTPLAQLPPVEMVQDRMLKLFDSLADRADVDLRLFWLFRLAIATAFHVNDGLEDLLLAPDDEIQQPIIRVNRESGERGLVMARWGFVPSWHKPTEKFPPTTLMLALKVSRRLVCGNAPSRRIVA